MSTSGSLDSQQASETGDSDNGIASPEGQGNMVSPNPQRSEMSGESSRADTPCLGADESRDIVSNSDSSRTRAPQGDNVHHQGLRSASRCAPMQHNRWYENDVAKLLALYEKYEGDIQRPSKVLQDWENLRAAGDLVNCCKRSKKALQHAYRKNKPRGNENNDPNNETASEPSDVEQTLENEPPQQDETGEAEQPQREDAGFRRSQQYLAFKENNWEVAKREYKRACKARCMNRPALEKPKKPIPKELQLMGDALVCDLLEPHKDRASFEKLSSAVYAAGKVILTQMRGDSHQASRKEAVRTHKNRVEQSQRLSKFLAWTQEEIERRTKHTKLNDRLSRQLKGLRKEFSGLRQLPDFKELKETLVTKLRIVDKQIAARNDEVQRRRIRGLPLRRALERIENSSKAPTIPMSKVRNFWAGIIGQRKEFTMCPELENWKKCLQPKHRQEIDLKDTVEDWELVCKKAKSWKAPGPDGIHAGLWKCFPTAGKILHKWVISWIQGEKRIPDWFAKGRAILLYKKGDKSDPSNYRTICCLNTSYKLTTALITKWLQARLTELGALPQEQLAIKKEIWACCEAHFLDATITSDALCRSKRKQNSEVLNMAWIDFAKAFDSLPHSYVRWVLKSVGLDERVRHFLARLMKGWSIQYEQYSGPKIVKSRPLKVVNGVLQGDALSPLLYCICIAPISHWLNENIPVYVTAFGSRGENRQPVSLNHLYFMDDLKLHTPKRSDLERAVEGVERISGHIGSKIHADKSAIACIPGPNEDEVHENSVLNKFPVIGYNNVYKYLGIEQTVRISEEDLWTRISDAICKKTKCIFSSRLSTRQMVNGYNVTVPAIVRFVGMCSVIGKGAFKKHRATMEKLDGKVRKILAGCGARFLFQSLHRLYGAPEEGGLGLKRISDAFEEGIVYAYCYLACSPNLTNVHRFLRGSSTSRNVTTDFEQIMKEYGLNAVGDEPMVVATPGKLGVTINGEEIRTAKLAARAIIWGFKAKRREAVKRMMSGDNEDSAPGASEPGFMMAAMTTDYARWGTDPKLAWLWLKKGVIGPRVVRNIMAAQDNQLLAGYHRNIRKWCRFACNPSKPAEENVAHIVSGCGHCSASLYTERHNMVANDIYHALCKKYDLPTSKYQTRVSDVRENERAKLYWNRSVEAPVPVMHNQPDIVCFEKDATKPGRFKRIWIIEVAVAWYQGLKEKEQSKYHRYAINSQSDSRKPDVNLQSELGKMYGCKIETIPIVVGVFGEVSTQFATYLQRLELSKDIGGLAERLQRSAVLGTHWVIKAHMSVTPS